MQTQAWYQNSLFCAILVLCYPCWHIWCFVSVLSKVLELCRCLTCSLTHDGQCCCADHLVQGQLADRRHQPDPLVPDLQWQSHSSTTHGEPTSALPLPLSHCLPPRSCQSMQLPGQSDSSVSGGIGVPGTAQHVLAKGRGCEAGSCTEAKLAFAYLLMYQRNLNWG